MKKRVDPEYKTEFIQIRVSANQKRIFKLIADRDNISITTLILHAVFHYLIEIGEELAYELLPVIGRAK